MSFIQLTHMVGKDKKPVYINTEQIVNCAGLDPGSVQVAPSGSVKAAEAAQSSP